LKIFTYDASYNVELLKSHDQEITLDNLFKIRKQSAIEEAEELESKPRLGIMTVLNLTEGLGLTEADIEVPHVTDKTRSEQ
jgi:hypothetical protein